MHLPKWPRSQQYPYRGRQHKHQPLGAATDSLKASNRKATRQVCCCREEAISALNEAIFAVRSCAVLQSLVYRQKQAMVNEEVDAQALPLSLQLADAQHICAHSQAMSGFGMWEPKKKQCCRVNCQRPLRLH